MPRDYKVYLDDMLQALLRVATACLFCRGFFESNAHGTKIVPWLPTPGQADACAGRA